MQLNVISKVDIKIEEADLEELIREKVKSINPDVTVQNIDFTLRRDPKRLDITVDAYIGEPPMETSTETILNSEEEPLENTEPGDTTSLFQTSE